MTSGFTVDLADSLGEWCGHGPTGFKRDEDREFAVDHFDSALQRAEFNRCAPDRKLRQNRFE